MKVYQVAHVALGLLILGGAGACAKKGNTTIAIGTGGEGGTTTTTTTTSSTTSTTVACSATANEFSIAYAGLEIQDTAAKAQSFQLAAAEYLYSVEFYMRNLDGGAADMSATLTIYQDNGGDPDAGSVVATSNLTVPAGVAFAYREFVFPSYPQLQAGQTYWLVITGDKLFGVGGDGGDPYASGFGQRKNTGSWATTGLGDYTVRANVCN